MPPAICNQRDEPLVLSKPPYGFFVRSDETPQEYADSILCGGAG